MAKIYEELRPRPHLLTLLLRAAVAETGDGGPWLTVGRSWDKALTVHHINTSPRADESETGMTMLSGEEALYFGHTHHWDDLLNPSITELRGLIVHAMLNNDATLWARNYGAWVEWQRSPERLAVRERQYHDVRSVARALRWTWAEQWLSRQ